ncbi:MAG TPA: 50S ribosomal protein L4, partial [Chitinophagaceae bacterium]|nr:50S ribosomal protein L4 [Chitinophagaceae bacterium]
VELPDEIFGIEPNDHLIYLSVKQYLAAQRQGNSKVKTRAEVQGASRKLHKQKGTGGARKGNLRNPLYKGGGSIFGPTPRFYHLKLNRKVKDLAKVSALAHKAKANSIVVVEDMNLDTPRTKEFTAMLSGLNLANNKTLYIMPDYNENVYLSSRNLPRVKTCTLSDTNTYDIVNAKTLVLTEEAAKIFTQEELDHLA